MRRQPWLWLILLLACGTARVALAEPYFAVATGLKCSACHVNPTGGGMRNTFGSVWGQTVLPARQMIAEGGPLTGEVNRFLALGTNLRGSASWNDAPDSPSTSSFDLTSLRLYVDLRLIPERVAIYIDERLAPGSHAVASTRMSMRMIRASRM